MLSNGDGTFATPQQFGVGRDPASVLVADVNGDGRPDLITPNLQDGTISVRLGSQPFTSDFRGLIFSDTNRGARVFGNLNSNREQFNLAFFAQQEKDTNSGLNTLSDRNQRCGDVGTDDRPIQLYEGLGVLPIESRVGGAKPEQAAYFCIACLACPR